MEDDKDPKKPEWKDKVPIGLLDSYNKIIERRRKNIKMGEQFSIKKIMVLGGSKGTCYADSCVTFIVENDTLKVKMEAEEVEGRIKTEVSIVFSKVFDFGENSCGIGVQIFEELDTTALQVILEAANATDVIAMLQRLKTVKKSIVPMESIF